MWTRPRCWIFCLGMNRTERQPGLIMRIMWGYCAISLKSFVSKITVKDIAEKEKRCCIIIANRAIVRQHLNYYFMQQSPLPL